MLSRRRQDPGDVGAGEDLPDRRRGRREDVLAVVDQDEQPASGHCLGDRVDDASIALRGDAQGGGDRVGDRVGVAHGGQLDQPRAVRELVGELRADREGESGLADASHAAEGDELTGADQRRQLGQHLGAPDEGGGGARQVAAPRLQAHRRQSGTDDIGCAASGRCGAPFRVRSGTPCPVACRADPGGRDGPSDAAGVRRGRAEPSDRRARRGGDGRSSPTARPGRSAAWRATS